MGDGREIMALQFNEMAVETNSRDRCFYGAYGCLGVCAGVDSITLVRTFGEANCA